MESVTATYQNGHLELAEPVDWPDGTQVHVTPVGGSRQRVNWLSLPPLDVGQFREVSADDDLLSEMLDDSRG
jgi:hypothetical protein